MVFEPFVDFDVNIKGRFIQIKKVSESARVLEDFELVFEWALHSNLKTLDFTQAANYSDLHLQMGTLCTQRQSELICEFYEPVDQTMPPVESSLTPGTYSVESFEIEDTSVKISIRCLSYSTLFWVLNELPKGLDLCGMKSRQGLTHLELRLVQPCSPLIRHKILFNLKLLLDYESETIDLIHPPSLGSRKENHAINYLKKAKPEAHPLKALLEVGQDGNAYFGEFRGSDKHGFGVGIHKDEQFYEGEWANNYACGLGVQVFHKADGHKVFCGLQEETISKGLLFRMKVGVVRQQLEKASCVTRVVVVPQMIELKECIRLPLRDWRCPEFSTFLTLLGLPTATVDRITRKLECEEGPPLPFLLISPTHSFWNRLFWTKSHYQVVLTALSYLLRFEKLAYLRELPGSGIPYFRNVDPSMEFVQSDVHGFLANGRFSSLSWASLGNRLVALKEDKGFIYAEDGDPSGGYCSEDLFRELQILETLKPHPNIVKFLGVGKCARELQPNVGAKLFLVTELCETNLYALLYRISEVVSEDRRRRDIREGRPSGSEPTCCKAMVSETANQLAADEDINMFNVHIDSPTFGHTFAKQILSALEFLDSHNIAHGDLKSPNILVNYSRPQQQSAPAILRRFSRSFLPVTPNALSFRFLLSDFGCSRLSSPAPSKTFIPTHLCTRWSSPEMFQGYLPSPASDIFSFGLMLFECVYRELPFSSGHWTPQQVSLAVGRANVKVESNSGKLVDPLLTAMIDRCVSPHVERPTAASLLKDFESP